MRESRFVVGSFVEIQLFVCCSSIYDVETVKRLNGEAICRLPAVGRFDRLVVSSFKRYFNYMPKWLKNQKKRAMKPRFP